MEGSWRVQQFGRCGLRSQLQNQVSSSLARSIRKGMKSPRPRELLSGMFFFSADVRDFTCGLGFFFQICSYTFYTLELCRAQITFSEMEKSLTCDPGISLVFHVSLPWEVLKVSVFSLVCIKPEFLVRKKRCCGQSPKSYSFIYSLVTTYSNVAHH